MSEVAGSPAGIRYVSSEVERMAKRLSLGDNHVRTALQIYKQVLDSAYDYPGYDDISPAVLYLADRVVGPNVTLRDVARVARRDMSEIQTIAQSIKDELTLPVKIQTPENIMSEKLDELGLAEYEPQLQALMGKVDKQYKGSKPPASVAAALVYIGGDIFDYEVTRADVADPFPVTSVTIGNRYPELIENSSISPPADQRRFETLDDALLTLKDELDIPEQMFEEMEARVTLIKRDLGNAASEAGVVLGALAATASDYESRPKLADPSYLADFAKVKEQTIEKYRDQFENP